MRQTVTMVKMDMGYNAKVVDKTSSYIIQNDEIIQNRNFKRYNTGDKFEVEFNITPTGRRIYRYSILITAAPVKAANATISTPAPEKEPCTVKTAKPKDALTGYYVNEESRLIFNTALTMSRSKPERAVKIMMVGASGYGKTTLPKHFSELIDAKFMRMNCATIRDPEEWFGFREARDGSTVFIKSQFARSIEEGNLVVVLDEFNRLEPWLHNTLFPLLDDDGCTVVHDEEFRIGPNVIVVGTINTGYKYTGTFELDEALLNRFDFILEVGPMPHQEEVKVLTKRTGIERDVAASIVKMSNTLRSSEIVCSTRTSLLVANMVVNGMSVREAFETAVVRRIPADSNGAGMRKQVVDQINVAFGPFEIRKITPDVFSKGEPAPAPVVKAAPAESEPIAPVVFTVAWNKGVELLTIGVISLLRTLPIAGQDPKTGHLTLSEANAYTKEISNGETLCLHLTKKPDDLHDVVATAKSLGLTGSFSVTKTA